ncbi:MAG: DUF1571 domain-containing protein, partial [Phycisphaerae bacterium]
MRASVGTTMIGFGQDRPKPQVQASIGLALVVAFCVHCSQSQSAGPHGPAQSLIQSLQPAVAAVQPPSGDAYEALAARDPLALLETALQHYRRSVRDYVATFTKQERIGGRLSARQKIRVKFKQEPFSVLMHWIKNADKARR